MCVFADDLMINALNEQKLKQNSRTWVEQLRKRNIKLNSNNTKIIVTGEGTLFINIEQQLTNRTSRQLEIPGSINR